MLAVQTIRTTTRSAPEGATSARQWDSYKAMTRPIESAASAYLCSMKRKRDCFEAYDYQAHRQQRMRYSLLREQPKGHQHSSSTYPRESLEEMANNAFVPPRRDSPPPLPYPIEGQASSTPSTRTDNILRARRRSSGNRKPKKSSGRRTVRMTRKHYNKKKKLEMMEATDRHIRNILDSNRANLSIATYERVYSVRQMAEQLDLAIRDQCNSIVQKEQDIKSWLGMTTGNKSKIVSLRKQLHERWTEVKELQSAVKPRRQRLKNLRFAAICVERSISEE